MEVNSLEIVAKIPNKMTAKIRVLAVQNANFKCWQALYSFIKITAVEGHLHFYYFCIKNEHSCGI